MNLQKSYNCISKEFSSTRHTKWPCVNKFFDDYVSPKSFLLDAGCGNGKNISQKHYFEVCDITEGFLDIVKNKYNNVGIVQSNVQQLPYVSNKFDHVICVAVIHHLNTEELRIKAIHELIRCTKPNGKILITNWAFENNKFETQDCFIPFKSKSGEILTQRYYHLFTEYELPKYISALNNCNLIEYYNEYNNWIGIIEKTI